MLEKKNSTKIDIVLRTPERISYACNISSKIKDVNEDQFLSLNSNFKTRYLVTSIPFI